MVTDIINNALVKVQEYGVKNPRTYVAHRSKVRVAKRFGEKDVDPLFKLPRLPAEAIKDLENELSEFELPARQLDADVVDEFHSQASEIHRRGKDHRSSISSNPPVIPQNFSSSSIAASSEDSEDGLFQSFIQSPGSARSNSSNPEQLFQNHFQGEEEPQDEVLQETPAEDEEVTGSAANLIPEPEPEPVKTPENSGTGGSSEPRERDVDPAGINTPTGEQEERRTRGGGGIPEKIYTPPNRMLKQQNLPLMK